MLLLGKIYYDNNDFEKAQKIFADLEKINQNATIEGQNLKSHLPTHLTPEVMNYLGLIKLGETTLIKR